VSVLPGNGDGTFQKAQSFAVGSAPQSLALADVNGDGKLDIVTANLNDNTVSVLAGTGHGTFQDAQTFNVGSAPQSVVVADLNGDGRPDIVTANKFGNSVSTLLGNGDGTFQNAQTFGVGSSPHSVAVADVNGDGKPDIITANRYDNTVSVLLGNGDGTFQKARTYAVGSEPFSVAVADLNGDGRPDIVTANYLDNTVSVLLGNGDGTFQNAKTFAVGSEPFSVAVADLTGDGKPDIITANSGDNTVSVLLGNGDGTFQKARTFAVGLTPQSVAVADVNGDGKPDIVTANIGDNTVSVLLGNGDGTFQKARTFAVGMGPDAVSVTDVNGDGKPDIITANNADGTVSVLLGNGDGTFQKAQTYAVGSAPHSMTVADVNGDGRPDIITANNGDDTVSVLLGNGNGTFQKAQTFAVGSEPESLAVADFNGDGRPDIVTANGGGAGVSVLLGNGDGTFTPSTPLNGVGLRNTPYLADLDGDGTPDSVILDGAGNILFRKGLAGTVDQFASPVILNDLAAIGENRPARDLTVFRTETGWAIATADTGFDPTLSSPGHFVYTVSLYTVAADGSVTHATAFSTPFLPTRIAAADLTGNGLDDLVVASSLDNNVQVAFQQPDGMFSSPLTLPVGVAPSDIALVDVDVDGLKDIVVSNQASGTVTVLLNDKKHSFSRSETFRAGTSLTDVIPETTGATVSSLAQTVSLAAGNFTSTGRNDLVVVNRGTPSFTVLPNDGSGFSDPQSGLTTPTNAGSLINDQPGPVVTADFHGSDGLDSHRAATGDLAILMEDRGEVWIYTNNGDGTFTLGQQIPVGSQATGLSVVPGSSSGLFDLLVGNPFGDVLIIHGKGDGTFQPFTRADQAVPFVTVNHNGQQDVILANQAADQVVSQIRKAGVASFISGAFSQQGHGLIGPGAIKLADLNGDGYPDLIVANSDGNDILVYMGLPGGGFESKPRTFFVGTNPVSITVQDLNHDGILDIAVANRGSNDVSILFGKGTRQANGLVTNWGLRAGPRLKAGFSPIGVTFRDVTGDHIPDMIVTDAQTGPTGNVTILPGIGKNGQGTGFYQDNKPLSFPVVPGSPIGALTSEPLPGQPGLYLLPTTQGIFQVNLNSQTVTEVFVSSDLTTISVGAGGEVAAGFSNGSVELLQADNTGLLAEARIFHDPGLTEPSALQLVSNDGQPEIYATTAGEDTVFVFGLSEGIPIPGFTSSFEPRGPSAEVQPLSPAGVSLVATIVTDTGTDSPAVSLLGDIQVDGTGMEGSGFGVGVGGPGPQVLATNLIVLEVGAARDFHAGGAAGEGPEEEPTDVPSPPPDTPETSAAFSGYLSGVAEALQALGRLFREQRGGAGADQPRPADPNDGEPQSTLDPLFRLVPRSGLEPELSEWQADCTLLWRGRDTQARSASDPIPSSDGIPASAEIPAPALRACIVRLPVDPVSFGQTKAGSTADAEMFVGPEWYAWQRGLLLGLLLSGLWQWCAEPPVKTSQGGGPPGTGSPLKKR